MTRSELDAALARLGLAVPEGERDEIVAAAHLIEDMVARLRPVGGRDCRRAGARRSFSRRLNHGPALPDDRRGGAADREARIVAG